MSLEIQACGARFKLVFGRVKTWELPHDKMKSFGKGIWLIKKKLYFHDILIESNCQ